MNRFTASLVAMAGAGALVAAGLLGQGVAAAASTPTWAVQPTPNPPASQGGQLNDVTCTSAGECMAVGTYGAANGSFTLAEFFNGSTWSIKATPGGGTDAGLSGVACASAVSCIAVGFTNSSPLIESWNGTVWKVDDSTGTGSLIEIKCAGADCVAVGQNGSGKPLVESYNGSVWSVQAVPSAVTGTLFGVSCVTTSNCFATGDNENGGNSPLILHWNGATWTSQGSPTIPKAVGDDVNLNSVACFKSDCTATGYYAVASPGLTNYNSLAERWNGKSWAVQKTPDPSEVNQLVAVRCVSATNCTAVGQSGDADCCAEIWAAHWNGTTWSTQATPNPAETGGDFFDGLSCSTKACTAVGSNINAESGESVTLAEHN